MKVVVCKPDQVPQVQDINSDLHSMQEIVGGYIEVAPFPGQSEVYQGAIIVCNEEGLLKDLPSNRLGMVGTFFVVQTHGNSQFNSLTDDEAEAVVAYLTNAKNKEAYNMRHVLNPATSEVIKHCPRCGATETMFKATVRLCVNPLLTSRGFFCVECNLHIELVGWTDIIETEDLIKSWEENGAQ